MLEDALISSVSKNTAYLFAKFVLQRLTKYLLHNELAHESCHSCDLNSKIEVTRNVGEFSGGSRVFEAQWR